MNTEQERSDFEAWHTEAFWSPVFDNDEECFIPRVVQSRYEAYQAGRAALQSRDQDEAYRAMAAEYQRWIDAYHQGVDYEDFLKNEVRRIEGEARP